MGLAMKVGIGKQTGTKEKRVASHARVEEGRSCEIIIGDCIVMSDDDVYPALTEAGVAGILRLLYCRGKCKMAQTHDHEIVSIYPFTDEEIDQLMNNANECVLMWATRDGWPVGVTHAFVWHEGKIWITFSEHRHRTAAIRRDNRVSVNVSSCGYPPGADVARLPGGAVTFKGTGDFFQDDDTRKWLYTALSRKLNPDDAGGEAFFYNLLDSPLRIILAVTPTKKIMYNSTMAGRHMAGAVDESELGERLPVDRERMNRLRASKGLDSR